MSSLSFSGADLYDPGPGMQGPKKNDPLADPVGYGLNQLGFFGKPVKYDPYSTQLANLSRSQFSQGSDLLYPAQSSLIQYAENPNYISNQAQQAGADANHAFDAQQQGQQRQYGLMGINPTAAQSAALGTSSALARAKGVAGAENQAAQSAYQNQQAALGGIS